ncbi:MAG: lipoprotein [Gammaproteobacteria bacterium]
MNRISLVFFLFSMMLFSACGQYGPLYAPTEETTSVETESTENEEKAKEEN